MPAFETMDRYQVAVLWPKTGTNRNGQPIVSPTPVQIRVRWDDQQAERLDPQGNTIRIDATVVVDREIEVGSIMYKGSISDFAGTGSDEEPAGLMLVKSYDETPDIKKRFKRRVVTLMRYTDSLPTS